jgi:hypothetical protein
MVIIETDFDGARLASVLHKSCSYMEAMGGVVALYHREQDFVATSSSMTKDRTQ